MPTKSLHSGKNFAVAFGYSDSYNDSQATYDKCAKIYLTDATGYRVVTTNTPVKGTPKYGKFNSVWVCNTTYTYLVMKDGNSFTQGRWASTRYIGFDNPPVSDYGN